MTSTHLEARNDLDAKLRVRAEMADLEVFNLGLEFSCKTLSEHYILHD